MATVLSAEERQAVVDSIKNKARLCASKQKKFSSQLASACIAHLEGDLPDASFDWFFSLEVMLPISTLTDCKVETDAIVSDLLDWIIFTITTPFHAAIGDKEAVLQGN